MVRGVKRLSFSGPVDLVLKLYEYIIPEYKYTNSYKDDLFINGRTYPNCWNALLL